VILIVGDVPEVTDPLATALSARGLPSCVVTIGEVTSAVGPGRVEFACGSEELPRVIAESQGKRVGGVISLLGLMDQYREPVLPTERTVSRMTQALFQVLKAVHDDLCTAGKTGTPRVMNVTSIDGAFGLNSSAVDRPAIAAAGTVGLCKAYRAEVPGSVVTCLDVADDVPRNELMEFLVEHIDVDPGAVEIGLARGKQWRILTREETAGASASQPMVHPGDVWLVTGGADGITATITRVLARRGCRLVIIGRTRLHEEIAETIGQDEATLRKYFLDAAKRSGQPVVPATIERKVQEVLKQRRIVAHLNEFRALGGAVQYVSCDVRNSDEFGRVIDDTYERYGRIDGVIHGAGVIIDKLIDKKTPEAFATVFETKVNSALTLARHLRPESVKFLGFFSSTSARFGNRGQTDYSAANEFLNKLSDRLSRSWPGRVVAINWGPWDSGMVSPELRRAYADLDIELIPPQVGVDLFEAELLAGAGPSEVVITASINRIEAVLADMTGKVQP